MDLNQETALQIHEPSGYLVSPRNDRITPEQKQLVVSIYGEKGNLSEAARITGVTLRGIRQLRAEDEAFNQALTECEHAFVENAKGWMLTHMARPGNYMDRVTIARRFEPGVWGDQVNHTVTHNVELTKNLADKARQLLPPEGK